MSCWRRGVGAAGRPLSSSLAALLIGLSLAPSQACGQHGVRSTPTMRSVHIALEAGGVVATPFTEDGNGVTVRAGPGVFLGGLVSVPVLPRVLVVGAVRGSVSALRLESAAGRWRGGTTSQADLRIGMEGSVARGTRIAATAAVARAAGPADVVPFRASGGHAWMWGTELAGIFTVPRQSRIAIIVAASAVRISSRPRAEPPIDGGWVGQLRLGVRGGVR